MADKKEILLELARVAYKDYASKDEVAKILTDTLKQVSKVIQTLKADVATSEVVSKQEIRNAVNALNGSIIALDKVVQKNKRDTQSKLEELVDEFDRGLKEIIDTIPEEQDLTSLEKSIQECMDMMPVPETPEQTRDKLESLEADDRLDVSAIKGLEELLEKLRKQIKKGAGGSSQLDVSHWPVHETFTMNGSDTSVTLSRGVSASGTALIVRYNGQTLDLTTHYTVSGNKITFVGFTPETSTVISVTYWP